MYIAIEGIDTAGKSTQISNIAKHYPDAVITKEPGATEIGKEIREMVLSARAQSKKAEFLLFLADRAEHIKEVIEPNISKMIISDRSAVSGVAYALVQNEISKEDLVSLNNFATNGIYPEKVFLLKLTKEELEYRLSQKELDGIELRGVEYLLGIQKAIVEATKLLNLELVEIDATKSIDEITKKILVNINKEFTNIGVKLNKNIKNFLIIISIILSIAIAGIFYTYSNHQQVITKNKELIKKEQVEIVFSNKRAQFEQAFKKMYESARTISLLPSVRQIDSGNRLSEDEDIVKNGRFSEDAFATVQQLYNDLVSNINVSEIYAVADGLDFQKGQFPFFMFDSLVIGNEQESEDAGVVNPDFPEEAEEAEYLYYPTQIEYFKKNYPTFNYKDLSEIPAVFSPLLRTCDNTQYVSKSTGDVNPNKSIV